MKVIVSIAVFASALASSSLFAAGKTSTQVYQELIDAQQNGLNYVTDTSYPDVRPSFTAQVAQQKGTTAALSTGND
jgi:hypothetical protein